MPAPDKTHLAAVDDLDAGWEDPKDAALDAGRRNAHTKDAAIDALDAGWGDDEDEADPGAEDPSDTGPEEVDEPEPPGLTPEQRRARKADLATRAAARKERARAQAIAKKERRKARADAGAASKKKKQKSPTRRDPRSEPRPRAADVRSVDSSPSEVIRIPTRPNRAMTIVLMVAVALVATAGVVVLLRK